MHSAQSLELRIAVISPVVATDAIDVEATLEPLRGSRVLIRNFFLASGPPSIETDDDVALCLPHLIERGLQLWREGWDALVINCMCDPGVPELRERVSVPVLGPAETSMHVIAAAGGRFSLLDVVSGGRALVEAQVGQFGVRQHYVSHYAINVPVLELYAAPEHTVNALVECARRAVDDGADTLLLGCTGLAVIARALVGRLFDIGLNAAVIEPLQITLRVAHAIAEGRGRRTVFGGSR